MNKIRQALSNRWLMLVFRLALGAIFLVSAVGKLQHSALFVDQVVDYGLLPEGLSRLYATVLPWAEVAVGFSLLLGLLSAVGAIVSVAMTASFAIAGIYSLVRPDEVPSLCGCFGELVDLSHAQSLTLDVAMLMAAVVIVMSWRRADELGAMSLVRGIVRGRPAWLPTAFKLAAVAVLTLALGLAVMATRDKPADELPFTERPRLMYFWNGCPDCYGEEVEQVESLEPEYSERVDFVEVDYVRDPSSLSTYGVSEDDFTVLLLTWQTDTAAYAEQARFVGNLSVGTFNLAAMRDGLETLLNAGGQQA